MLIAVDIIVLFNIGLTTGDGTPQRVHPSDRCACPLSPSVRWLHSRFHAKQFCRL